MDNISKLYLSIDASPRAKRLLSLRPLVQLVQGQGLQGQEQLACTDVVLKRHSTYDVGDDARRLEMLKVLVQCGADVNVQSRTVGFYWKTAAMIAAQQGFLQCLKFLVESGADLSMVTPRPKAKCKSRTRSYYDTALTLAVRFGQSACVAYLTQHMSLEVINHKNSSGLNALMLAAHSNGPDVHDETKAKCLEHLLAAGADANMEDKHGCTALMRALEKGHTKTVDMLLQHGARLDTVSCDGRTPLNIVTTRGEYLFKLLRHGLDPGLFSMDRSCLHSSVALRDKVKVVHALVESGMPPLDLSWTNYRFDDNNYLFRIVRYTPSIMWRDISPLTVALLAHRPCVAKYLINKRFFTNFDIHHLRRDWSILEALKYESEKQKGAAQECLELFYYLYSEIKSLQTLSLIAVSTACSQVRCYIPEGKCNRILKPTFKERVRCLPLPELMKRQLLHQTPSAPSDICCEAWRDMPHFSDRYCELYLKVAKRPQTLFSDESSFED